MATLQQWVLHPWRESFREVPARVLWEVAWDQRPECERVTAVIGRHRGTWGGAGLARDGAR